MNYAVIDLGSNTIRLSVYRCEESKFSVVFKQKEVAGLASFITDNIMDNEGVEKACNILKEFKEIALRFVSDTDIYVFATASLRRIDNREQVLAEIHQNTGLEPEVLSGEEEARLGFIGASHFVPCDEGVLIDIGGASTELVRFQDGQPVDLISLPMGCLSLYTQYVSQVIADEKERKQIKKEIRNHFDQIQWLKAENCPTLIIGVGGTVRGVQKLAWDLFSLPKGAQDIPAKYIKKIIKMLKNEDAEIFHTVYKRIPERTLTISTGLMILREAMERFGCETLSVSSYGVREGFLIERVLKEETSYAEGDAEQGTILAEI